MTERERPQILGPPGVCTFALGEPLGLVVVGLGLFGAHGIAGQAAGRKVQRPATTAASRESRSHAVTGARRPACSTGARRAMPGHPDGGSHLGQRSSWRTVRPATRAAIGATAAPFVAIPAARSCSCARRA